METLHYRFTVDHTTGVLGPINIVSRVTVISKDDANVHPGILPTEPDLKKE